MISSKSASNSCRGYMCCRGVSSQVRICGGRRNKMSSTEGHKVSRSGNRVVLFVSDSSF